MTYTLTPAQSKICALVHWARDIEAFALLAQPGYETYGPNFAANILGGTPKDMYEISIVNNNLVMADEGYHFEPSNGYLRWGEALVGLGTYPGQASDYNPFADKRVPTVAELAPYLVKYAGATFWQGGASIYPPKPVLTPPGWHLGGSSTIQWIRDNAVQPPTPPAPTPTPDPSLPPGWPPGAPPPTPSPAPVPPVVAPCPPGALCLGPAGRFQVRVGFTTGPTLNFGVPIPLTADTGAFWFFNDKNYELMVKVLDGTTQNGHWWVFYGSLTDVAFTLAVKDSKTGAVKTYTNPHGTMASVGDTEAFAL